jgi:putative glutamine amidotransferase
MTFQLFARYIEQDPTLKPVIGITPSPSQDEMVHGAFYRYALSRTYVDSVRAAGGVPIILPTDQQDLEDILPRLNGLLLSGGGDIDPALYGEDTVHETTYGIDSERDAFEIAAFLYAESHDLPTLCICRGIQVMAVAMGGTLEQDIPSTHPESLEHRQQQTGRMRDDVSQTVVIAPGNPLACAVNRDRMEVNSFHHQSVRSAGPILVTVATAEDGTIEGLWHPGMTFGIGVQWHPEMLAANHPDHASLFRALIDAAAADVA